MKRHLNTLFVATQNSWLSKEGECVALSCEGKTLGKIPIHTLDGLVCFGAVSCSPFLLGHCAENGVTVSWLTEYGRFLASMHGPTTGNVLLRRTQYRMADSEPDSARLARCFTIGKISNCRTVLLRHLRQQPDADPEMQAAIQHLSRCLQRLAQPLPLDEVRGVEGDAARIYFSVFGRLVRVPDFAFQGRNRRPPRDEINCLLSFLYTLLVHDIRSALDSVGLDPAVGFLHRDRPGRPSLALDMMEEFRPYIADRLALTLINRKQIQASDFRHTETGAVLLKDDARKDILTAWQDRKREEIEHPFLGEKMTLGLLWHMQARLLARHLRGDLDTYPPFVIR